MSAFIAMYNPSLPGNPHVLAPVRAEAAYVAHGWLVVDGTTPPAENINLTTSAGDQRYAKVSDVGDPFTMTGAALRVALVPGSVYNYNGSLNATKRLHVKLTADGTDIDDLIIETVS